MNIIIVSWSFKRWHWRLHQVNRFEAFLVACVKTSVTGFCDANFPYSALTSSNTHHHGSVTITPVAPERQVTTTFKTAAAVRVA